MKRILLRMAALATVVVLGLIAIAQAQRAARDRSHPSNPVQNDASPTGGAHHRSGVGPSTAPKPFPGAENANPLRPAEASARPATTIPTSGQSSGPNPVSPAGSPPPDGARTGGLPTPGTDQPPETLRLDLGPRQGPAGTPTTPGDSVPPGSAPRNTQLPSLGAAAPLQSAGRAVDGRSSYGPPDPSDAEDDVPGTFNPDPQFPTSSIAPGRSEGFGRDGDSPAGRLVLPGQGSAATSQMNGEGNGTPGIATLEGAQSPQLTIQKFAPAAIRVGEATRFRIIIRNSGQVTARDVVVRDEIPKGTRLVSTTPPASRGVAGELVWNLGPMNPGDETTLESELMPVEEGEIGSVATVHFSADASAKAIATKPELVVETSAPRQVLIGQEVVLKITISNPGSGTATGVVLEERVPPGLQHAAGSELEYEVGTLEPNESRQIELRMTAERPGPATNVLVARGDANLKAEDRVDMEVLAPQLAVRMEGPTRRYLDREATYTLSVENPGTAPAQNVDLVAYLPHGLRFVRANNAGYYDQSERTVRWRLAELPVSEVGTVQLTTIPIESGEHSLRFVGSTATGLHAEQERSIQVEGITALLFEVLDVDDPIEKGSQTTYEIRVLNQGSKAATNLRLTVSLPPELQPVAAEGPPGIQHHSQGNTVTFESLARLAPKADTTYRVRAQGLAPGDLRVTVQLMADELQQPVTKQESTRVYADP